jgi:toxin ParE1/3/4
MSRFLFRPKALDDLRDLLTYIATDSPKAAERMHDCILETCQILADNPLIVHELDGLSISGIRRIPVVSYPRYSVFYRIVEDHIEVIRLGYGGRDWENTL